MTKNVNKRGWGGRNASSKVIKSYVEYFLKKINYHFEIKKVHSTKI
jgi:hypothetical protein